MQLRQTIRRGYGRFRPGLHTLLGLAFAALALAGCANGDPTVAGSLPPPVGATAIAFESVDGPPKPVFDRLVAALSGEAQRRDLPVVSHASPAAYRVRAYLAAHIEKKKKQATLSWVWEVFDAHQNRAFRLSGEEKLGSPHSDVWAQCDDALLERIAAKGFEALSARLGFLPATPAPAGEPEASDPLVASAAEPHTIAFADPHH